MPKYSYYCDNCQTEFEISHSIKEKLEKCGVCGVDDALEKLPSIPIIMSRNSSKNSTKSKVGEVVEEYIEKNRKQLAEEKKRLKEVEYK
jgi:putative FmdB family regulatory protein